MYMTTLRTRVRSVKEVCCLSWEKTSEATGYCKRTVERIIAEKRKLKGAEFTSPEKRYKKSRLRIVVDDFDCDAIRRTVHEFYAKKEYPTLDKLLQILKEKELFTGGRINLWKLLRKIDLDTRRLMISVMCMSNQR